MRELKQRKESQIKMIGIFKDHIEEEKYEESEKSSVVDVEPTINPRNNKEQLFDSFEKTTFRRNTH